MEIDAKEGSQSNTRSMEEPIRSYSSSLGKTAPFCFKNLESLRMRDRE